MWEGTGSAEERWPSKPDLHHWPSVSSKQKEKRIRPLKGKSKSGPTPKGASILSSSRVLQSHSSSLTPRCQFPITDTGHCANKHRKQNRQKSSKPSRVGKSTKPPRPLSHQRPLPEAPHAASRGRDPLELPRDPAPVLGAAGSPLPGLQSPRCPPGPRPRSLGVTRAPGQAAAVAGALHRPARMVLGAAELLGGQLQEGRPAGRRGGPRHRPLGSAAPGFGRGLPATPRA